MTVNPRLIKNPNTAGGLVSLFKQTSNTQLGGSCLADVLPSNKAWITYIDSSAVWNLDYTVDISIGSPVFNNYLKVNTSGIITPSVYSDILRARSGTATFSFQGQSGSAVGYITDGGAWTLGIPIGLNYNGPLHSISGHLAVNTPTSPSTNQSGLISISTNLKYNTYGNRYNATVGGVGISLDTRTSASNVALTIWSNQPGDATGTASIAKATMTYTGDWNFPVSVTTPNITISSTLTFTGSASQAAFYNSPYFYSSNGSYYAGFYDSVSAWTLGDSGHPNNIHTIYGYLRPAVLKKTILKYQNNTYTAYVSKLCFPTPIIDKRGVGEVTGTGANNGTWTFTSVETGYYRINVSLIQDGATPPVGVGYIGIQIFVNGGLSNTIGLTCFPSQGNYYQVTGTGIFYLVAGYTVQAGLIASNITLNFLTNGNNHNFIEIEQIG